MRAHRHCQVGSYSCLTCASAQSSLGHRVHEILWGKPFKLFGGHKHVHDDTKGPCEIQTQFSRDKPSAPESTSCISSRSSNKSWRVVRSSWRRTPDKAPNAASPSPTGAHGMQILAGHPRRANTTLPQIPILCYGTEQQLASKL